MERRLHIHKGITSAKKDTAKKPLYDRKAGAHKSLYIVGLYPNLKAPYKKGSTPTSEKAAKNSRDIAHQSTEKKSKEE